MIRVFHAVPFGLLFGDTSAKFVLELLSTGQLTYEHVADVLDTDDLEKAFRLTNTIEHPWWTNYGITKRFKGRGHRSSSVGDVFMAFDDAFIVAPAGFTKLPPEARAHLIAKP